MVDRGIFRRIGDCPTPWPCFVIAAHNRFIEKHNTALKSVLEVINTVTKEFKMITDIDKTIAKRYQQKIEDVQAWLKQTQWSQNSIPIDSIDCVQNTLMDGKLIDAKLKNSIFFG